MAFLVYFRCLNAAASAMNAGDDRRRLGPKPAKVETF
jgi:hypothetical protein